MPVCSNCDEFYSAKKGALIWGIGNLFLLCISCYLDYLSALLPEWTDGPAKPDVTGAENGSTMPQRS